MEIDFRNMSDDQLIGLKCCLVPSSGIRVVYGPISRGSDGGLVIKDEIGVEAPIIWWHKLFDDYLEAEAYREYYHAEKVEEYEQLKN